VSALLGADLHGDGARVASWNVSHSGRATVDSVELRAASPRRPRRRSSRCLRVSGLRGAAARLDLAALLAVLKQRGRRAKLRTGGVVPEAIPEPGDVARFIVACAAAGVAVQGDGRASSSGARGAPLGYEASSPHAVMHGFLNVFAAAAFASTAAPPRRSRRCCASRTRARSSRRDRSRLARPAARHRGDRIASAATSRRPSAPAPSPSRSPTCERSRCCNDAEARRHPRPSAPQLRAVRNDEATDFPIQNLPLGVFRRGDGAPRIGSAIGDELIDLHACSERGLLRGLPAEVEAACRGASLNALMALDARVRGTLRNRLSHLLRAEGGFVTARSDAAHVLVPRAEAQMLLPAEVGDYTDFYASVFHATNVGKMLRPDNPLLSELQVGADRLPRPCVVARGERHARRAPAGPDRAGDGGEPRFGPSRSLDYELEVAAFLGPGNPLGAADPAGAGRGRLFGLCLLNDWSARDLQKWEYQPLGPFLAKSFATSISPWVVTLEALAPSACRPSRGRRTTRSRCRT
jgi:2-keto-4-pentenoate hydratase/2-oxohepta-3-ene-1,7-dioic acid hydratase in catechol pathway